MTTYPGGKNGSGVYQRIINLMPPHQGYIEPFLGGGAVLRLKRPACWSIGIDSDAAALDALAPWTAMIPGLQLIQADALEWLASTKIPGDSLVYCDPPYLMSTRRQHRPIYRYELSDDDHLFLLRVLLRLPCKVMLSGYWSELYAEELALWRTARFTTRTRGGSLAEEWLWMNYPAPLELHDYRYLGENFRERERIGRKRARWLARLRGMPELERFAILSALEELRSSTSAPGDVVHPGEHAVSDDGFEGFLPGAIAGSNAADHNAIPGDVITGNTH